MIKHIGLLAIAVFISGCSTTTTSNNATPSLETNKTVVYLVRHAEKLKSALRDPELSERGKEQAKSLAKKLSNIKLDKIYSTDYLRTQMTAAPTANAQGLEVMTYNIPVTLLAGKIEKLHKHQNVLVVGHSNTTPELIAELGIETPIVIKHDQYGDLFIVELSEDNANLKMDKFSI